MPPAPPRPFSHEVFARPRGRVSGITRRSELLPPGAERRADPRRCVELAVRYTSDSLSFEAVVRDLSHGGLFLATELLDPEGTRCFITVDLDDRPSISFIGVVRRVVERHTAEDAPAGLGVAFTSMGPEAEQWLHRLLDAVDLLDAARPA